MFDVITNVLAIFGIYALLWWCVEHLASPFEFAFKSIAPYLNCRKPLSLEMKFGKWAIVTGSTDGIGKQLAMELARKGLNICLIARTESKLMVMAREIGKKNKTKLVLRYFNFSKKNILNFIEIIL